MKLEWFVHQSDSWHRGKFWFDFGAQSKGGGPRSAQGPARAFVAIKGRLSRLKAPWAWSSPLLESVGQTLRLSCQRACKGMWLLIPWGQVVWGSFVLIQKQFNLIWFTLDKQHVYSHNNYWANNIVMLFYDSVLFITKLTEDGTFKQVWTAIVQF